MRGEIAMDNGEREGIHESYAHLLFHSGLRSSSLSLSLPRRCGGY